MKIYQQTRRCRFKRHLELCVPYKLDSKIFFREHQVPWEPLLASPCFTETHLYGWHVPKPTPLRSKQQQYESTERFLRTCVRAYALAESVTWIISLNSHHSHKLETTVLSPLYRHANWGNTGFSWRQWESGRGLETAVFMAGVLYSVKGLCSRNFWRNLETKKDPTSFPGYKSPSVSPISYL